MKLIIHMVLSSVSQNTFPRKSRLIHSFPVPTYFLDPLRINRQMVVRAFVPNVWWLSFGVYGGETEMMPFFRHADQWKGEQLTTTCQLPLLLLRTVRTWCGLQRRIFIYCSSCRSRVGTIDWIHDSCLLRPLALHPHPSLHRPPSPTQLFPIQ